MSGREPDAEWAWWGPLGRRSDERRRTLLDLVAGGVLSPHGAALLSVVLARRGSLIVVAGPSGAGKSTTLDALAALTPAGQRPIQLRGHYESFDFLDDPAIRPDSTLLLVNEISPHLPIYLWGEGVDRFLASGRAGFQLLATAHATSSAGLVGLLTGYPLRLPAPRITAFDLVVVLHAWQESTGIQRRVVEITGLAASDRGGVVLFPFLPKEGAADGIDGVSLGAWIDRARPDWGSLREEVSPRARAITDLLRGQPGSSSPEIVAALDAAVRRGR